MSLYAKGTKFFYIILFIINFLIIFYQPINALSDKRLCADENCSQIISLGRGLINYHAGEDGMISFKINSLMRIKSKGAGSNPDLWGVEVNGREGYVPKIFIREISVYIHDSKLLHIVNVQQSQNIKNAESQSVTSENVKNNVVSEQNNTTDTNSGTVHNNVNLNVNEATTEPTSLNLNNNETNTQEKEPNNTTKSSNNNITESTHPLSVNEATAQPTSLNLNNNETNTQEKELNNATKSSNNNISENIQNTQQEIVQETTPTPTPISIPTATPTLIPTSSIINSEESKDEEIKKTNELESKVPFEANEKQNEAQIIDNQPLESVSQILKNDNHVNITNNTIQSNDKPITYDNDTIANNTDVPQAYKNVNETIPKTQVPLLKQNNDDNDSSSATNNENITKNNENENNSDDDVDDDEDGDNEEDEDVDDEEEEDNEDHNDAKQGVENISVNETNVNIKLPNNDMSVSVGASQNDVPHQILVNKSEVEEDSVHNISTENISSIEFNETSIEKPRETDNDVILGDSKSLDVSTEMYHQTTPVSLYTSQPSVNPTEIPSLPNDVEVVTMATTKPSLDDDNIIHEANDSNETFGNNLFSSKEILYTEDYTKPNQEILSSNDNERTQQETEIVEQSVIEGEKLFNFVENVESLPSKVLTENPENLTPEIRSKEKGLFATILGTVNNVWSADKKLVKNNVGNHDSESRKIQENDHEVASNLYCEKLGPNECPRLRQQFQANSENCDCHLKQFKDSPLTLSIGEFVEQLMPKLLERSDLLLWLTITAVATILFVLGYYSFCNSSREGALLSKLNDLESTLLASHKENGVLKHNLMTTRQKLASIEDNSFSSNDMVASLKKELEEELMEKARLQDQIVNLQKELENAADAGIELNRIVAELLSNQSGDESILNSVEELQKQLNEQQNTILEINASLAEKSRENSELQLLLAEQNAQYESKMNNLQRDNDELEMEKSKLLERIEELRNDFDRDITAALESKNFEIKRLQSEMEELETKIENERTKWQTSVAKVEALEDCLKSIKRDPNIVNVNQIIDAANVKAEMLDAQKKVKILKEKLNMEVDARKLAENHLEIISNDVEKLKQSFNQAEKDKLEAQTRLEVLSNYFKEKETQLQKELSLKEAMWLKQQGETTSTVDRLTAQQDEIQALKSQNDSLRAEMEAQIAAYKAQMGTLENRAHETWLAARQADRRYEEARTEATALRRQLTAMASNNVGVGGVCAPNDIQNNKLLIGTNEERPSVPSPIHMETPSSPILGHMPPPPPFMGPPLPFMGMPPPPLPPPPPLSFVPSGEMRPAPLGRIMSPPPQRTSSGRFTPHADYDDYFEYDGGPANWHRHAYSPSLRTYRSLSPTDSRYKYDNERDVMSTYDTETDYSPPRSPITRGDIRKFRSSNDEAIRHPNYNNKIHSNVNNNNNNNDNDISKNNNNHSKHKKNANSTNKGILSSESEKSLNSSSYQQHDRRHQHLYQQSQHKMKRSDSGGKSLV